jgi:hypothetical protein
MERAVTLERMVLEMTPETAFSVWEKMLSVCVDRDNAYNAIVNVAGSRGRNHGMAQLVQLIRNDTRIGLLSTAWRRCRLELGSELAERCWGDLMDLSSGAGRSRPI